MIRIDKVGRFDCSISDKTRRIFSQVKLWLFKFDNNNYHDLIRLTDIIRLPNMIRLPDQICS